MMSGQRWEVLEETSPSGRTLFRCGVCGRVSPTPDKRCAGKSCHEAESQSVRPEVIAAAEKVLEERSQLWRDLSKL